MSSINLRHDGLLRLTRFERYLTTTTFLVLGMASVLPWNNIVYVMPYIADQYLDKWDSGNSLLGVYQLGKLVVQFVLLFVGAISEWYLYFGLTFGCILCSILGPCVFYGSIFQRIVLLHAACFVFGIGAGVVQGAGFSVAAILPVNQISIYCFGQGFATIFSVSLICLLCSTVLDLEHPEGVAVLTNLSGALSAALGLLCMLLLYITLRQPAAKEAVAQARGGPQGAPGAPDEDSETKTVALQDVTGDDNSNDNIDDNNIIINDNNNNNDNDNDNNNGKGEGKTKARLKLLYKVLKLAWVEFLSIFYLFFTTCNLFPRVGPLKWNVINPPRNYRAYLLAASPVGDALGRLLCTVAHKSVLLKKIIYFPPKYLPYIALSRVVMYVPFFLSKNLENNVYFNSFPVLALQLMLLTGTHGWISTVAFIYSFLKIPDNRDKGQVGPIGVFCLIMGIMSGVYLALLYK